MSRIALHVPWTMPGAAGSSPQPTRRGRVHRAFARLIAALMEAREREAERHMARLLAQSGGRLTDDLERRATRAFSGGFDGPGFR